LEELGGGHFSFKKEMCVAPGARENTSDSNGFLVAYICCLTAVMISLSFGALVTISGVRDFR
jgi:hypothetical protein